MERVFNAMETMKLLNISHPTLRKIIRSGQLRAVKVGRGYRVLESAIYDALGGGAEVDGGKVSAAQEQTV
jgi:excisionase family DNA binding protein